MPKKREEELYKFCERYWEGFNRAKDFKIINKALDQGSKKEQKLITIKNIEVHQNILNYINGLDVSYDCKKVVFTFWVYFKLHKQVSEYKTGKKYKNHCFSGGKRKYNMIKKISNIDPNLNINVDILNIDVLCKEELGVIRIEHTGIINLKFIERFVIKNDDNEIISLIEEGGIALNVFDFENIGLAFDFYNGSNGARQCKYEGCQNIFVARKSNQLCCKEHQGYKKIEEKVLNCVDCEKEFVVDGIVKNKTRCDECYEKYRKNTINENAKRYYKNKNN